MKILKLQADNIKKLIAVEITPEGNVVKITGKNGAGKTSVLDSIFWALAGTENIQSQPLRRGTTKGKIRLDLEDMIVTRTFTENGSSLIVENKDGLRFKSPQTMLDTLLGRLSFDPLAFMRMEPRKQLDTLRDLTGIKLSELDAEKASVFQSRTEINREAKALESRIDGIRLPPNCPKEEISIAELTDELRKQSAVANDNRIARDGFQRALTAQREQEAYLITLKGQIAEIQARINIAESKLKNLNVEIAQGSETIEGLTDPDLDALTKQISEAETTNKLARQWKEREELSNELRKKTEDSEDATEALEVIEAEKQNRISEAKMPLEGLTFSEGTVLYNGLPIEQISSAEQLKVSMAMAMSMNPKLKVIRITDGSLLDSESMKVVEQMSKEKDYQVWIESVDESGKVGIVIEDGLVKTVNKEE